MLTKKTSQLSEQRFVVLLIVVELVVAVLFCVYVRYDDSLDAADRRHFDRDNSSKAQDFKEHEDNYPCKLEPAREV
jgi:hypothetical protein